MRRIGTYAGFIAALFFAGASLAEPVTVTENKSHILRLQEAATTVIVANPAIAQITVESPRLILILGQQIGETNLVALDRNGREIANFDLIVAPEAARHVTVHRTADREETLSCQERCASIGTTGAAPAQAAPAPAAQPDPAAGGQQTPPAN